MKISWNYLQDFFTDKLDKKVVLERLTMAGLEVEDETPVAPEFSGIVVGEVISCEKHPDADKLSLCKVDAGDSEPLQIICGASNVAVGVKVPCAKVGAVLPENFKIAERKMRGLMSYGMLCSGNEIGCPDGVDGLLLLNNDAIPGTDIREYLDLNDSIIEFKITPNRGDCLSYTGLAREIHALTGYTLKDKELYSDFLTKKLENFSFNPEASDKCPHYVGLAIKNVNNAKASPAWLVKVLERSGLRPKSSLVDITNYVMIVLGQPMHAFDLSKLNSGIGFRLAKTGEELKLIDGTNARLVKDDLVITDGSDNPVAIAGVMGGLDSAVTEATTEILLESAFFLPEVIHGRAKAYGVSSDSAYRFERGVNPDIQHDAINLAAKLVLEICGGEVVGSIHSVKATQSQVKINIDYADMLKLIGEDIATVEIDKILADLGCQVVVEGEKRIITPPAYRFDLKIREDIIEEVIRVYGYDRIQAKMPILAHRFNSVDSKLNQLTSWKDALLNMGFNEVISYAFIEESYAELLADKKHDLIRLKNPLAGLAVMRNNLITDMVKTLQHNINRGYDSLRVFELARVFNGETADTQPLYLAGLIYGKHHAGWSEKPRQVDFYDLKSIVENLFSAYGKLDFTTLNDNPLFHPGRTANIVINGINVGVLGQLHPKLGQPLGLDILPYIFEVDTSLIQPEISYNLSSVSKFQKVNRDLAFILDKSVNVGDILKSISALQINDLLSSTIFDIFTGGNLADNQKSVALKFTFQSDHTLTDEEIVSYLELIKQKVATEYNGQLR
ncbi:MAG: phenylalanine--tRNA ligase subunit beta [Neisseriales bacterium]|nr:MAG: phenylalanine--tRNA ligase subunit beta [Neisseriales bacterium]